MWDRAIFEIKNQADFKDLAFKVFHYQYDHVAVYREFCDLLGVDRGKIAQLEHIPFLPIEFFKQRKVVSEGQKPLQVFRSSGTTGSTPSQHHVVDLDLYFRSARANFESIFGSLKEYTILALLPSYLERSDSSLVFMVDDFIRMARPGSGFFLDDRTELIRRLSELEKAGAKTLLIGVSFALLDLAREFPFPLEHTIVMETGGMKGRRKEMVREELHHVLKAGFGVKAIYSEYGMTELLSQAYSLGKGRFQCPPWMKVLTRDTEDPMTMVNGVTGGINVIDLANIHSCAFLATQDLGKVYPDGTFEVLGRFDNSDIRGCNLMMIDG